MISVFLGKKDLAGKNDGPVTQGGSYLNHPTNCAVENNEVYVVDTLNHRLRRTTKVNKPCLFDPGPDRSLFEKPESLAFFEALQDIDMKCGAEVLTNAFGYTFKDAALDYLVNGNEADLMAYVCMDDSDCGAAGLTARGQAECDCRAAFEEVVKNPVYLDCPIDNAANDDWHKISSLLFGCYTELNPRVVGAGGRITPSQLAVAQRTIASFLVQDVIDTIWDNGVPDPGNTADFYKLQT
jgi:hypothetical protein